jgi:hypothetical protein
LVEKYLFIWLYVKDARWSAKSLALAASSTYVVVSSPPCHRELWVERSNPARVKLFKNNKKCAWSFNGQGVNFSYFERCIDFLCHLVCIVIVCIGVK